MSNKKKLGIIYLKGLVSMEYVVNHINKKQENFGIKQSIYIYINGI